MLGKSIKKYLKELNEESLNGIEEESKRISEEVHGMSPQRILWDFANKIDDTNLWKDSGILPVLMPSRIISEQLLRESVKGKIPDGMAWQISGKICRSNFWRFSWINFHFLSR